MVDKPSRWNPEANDPKYLTGGEDACLRGRAVSTKLLCAKTVTDSNNFAGGERGNRTAGVLLHRHLFSHGNRKCNNAWGSRNTITCLCLSAGRDRTQRTEEQLHVALGGGNLGIPHETTGGHLGEHNAHLCLKPNGATRSSCYGGALGHLAIKRNQLGLVLLESQSHQATLGDGSNDWLLGVGQPAVGTTNCNNGSIKPCSQGLHAGGQGPGSNNMLLKGGPGNNNQLLVAGENLQGLGFGDALRPLFLRRRCWSEHMSTPGAGCHGGGG